MFQVGDAGLPASGDREQLDEGDPGNCPHCSARLTATLEWCPLCLTRIAPEPVTSPPPQQGAWPPPEPGTWPAPPAAGWPAPPAAEWPAPPSWTPPPDQRAGKGAIRLTIGIIALNIAVQGGLYLAERSGRMTTSTAISVGLWTGLIFYVLVVLLTVSNPSVSKVTPVWTLGRRAPGLAAGLVAGGGAALLVMLLQKALTQGPPGDPSVRFVVSGASPARVLVAVLLFVAVGPVVEEFVFRGVLAESLRARGVGRAMFISSLLFSLAHLRPNAIVYYLILGSLLGALYFRFGLRASIAAHAAFNGLLVAVAVLSVLGPAKTYHVADGAATLELPASWTSVSIPPGSPVQLGLIGPSGSSIAVEEAPEPPGTFDPAAVAARASDGGVPMPDGMYVVASTTASYPAGEAAVVTLGGRHSGEFDVMTARGAEWIFVFINGGSGPAQADFRQMLQTLQLGSISSPGQSLTGRPEGEQ